MYVAVHTVLFRFDRINGEISDTVSCFINTRAAYERAEMLSSIILALH